MEVDQTAPWPWSLSAQRPVPSIGRAVGRVVLEVLGNHPRNVPVMISACTYLQVLGGNPEHL